ncbi:transposase [Streptomyces sp. NPDC002589]|uniref:transposase n=1 Tax=Streptomyces sp. NPDC002589 TaxID=3154420 RepID=UPI0033260DC4
MRSVPGHCRVHGTRSLTAIPNLRQLRPVRRRRPASRDSGKISGNLHRPKRYSRRLQRVFYTSALISIRCCDESRRFYDRKRAEGIRHIQAVLALARRRVNVLWVLLRDGRCYGPIPPVTTAA